MDIEEKKKILLDAKEKKNEYEGLIKKANTLKLQDVKNRNNSHAKEIAELNLKASKMKSEVNEKMYKAAQIVGIFKEDRR